MKIKLDSRMLAVASFVREGAVLADIGTDHAYIPIHLVQNSKIKFAVASDINEGPLLAAKKNICDFHCEGKIATVKCDGLTGVMHYLPTDIVIAGMGGELICRILTDSMDEICSDEYENIRLILQPMTHQSQLRLFLYENGFTITDEKIVIGDRRIYQILCAEKSGVTSTLSQVESLLGKVNILRGGKDFISLCNLVISVLDNTIKGKARAELDCSEESRLIAEIKNLPTYKNQN